MDDYRHAIFKFTNDGKKLVQTIGEPNVHASDDKHFYRPTFMAFQTDGSFYVADGYPEYARREVRQGRQVHHGLGRAWRGGKETRPGYFNNVHGVAVDPETRQVFVNDRNNRRIQVFDENGKYLREWTLKWNRANLHFVHIDADRRCGCTTR